jgi:hypothetical protein
VDSYTALTQLVDYIKSDISITTELKGPRYEARGAHNVGSLLKTSLADSTTFVVEAVTLAQTLYDQIQPDRSGSWINCGGTGIG